MTVFIDTSAIVAVMDEGEPSRERIAETMANLLKERAIVTHNLVIIETVALLHRRVGKRAANTFLQELVPQLEVVNVDAQLMTRASDAYVHAPNRYSFVDVASFLVMRSNGWDTALAMDKDFQREGFTVIP